MSRIVLVIDLAAEADLWDPHEAIEDVLARGENLPTFEPGMPFVLPVGGSYAEDTVDGAFVAAEWVADGYTPTGGDPARLHVPIDREKRIGLYDSADLNPVERRAVDKFVGSLTALQMMAAMYGDDPDSDGLPLIDDDEDEDRP